MLKGQPIKKNSNTFFIIKAFNKFMCYESCFGNVCKIGGQLAYGPINRITPLIPFLKERDNNSKFKFFYLEPDLSSGLKQKPLPYLLKNKSSKNFSYSESNPTILDLYYKPYYDIIARGMRLYYCIEINNNFLLYDDDFGNPLMGDITDDKGNTYVLNSKIKKNTLTIINSLPKNSIVYSLRVTSSGITKGNKEMERFETDTAKELIKKTEKEKNTDSTRSSIIKNK